MLVRTILLASCVAMVSGCALGDLFDHNNPIEREDVVRRTAEIYVQSLRWGRMDEAAKLVDPDARLDFMKFFSGDDMPLNFTSAEINSVELGPGPVQATVFVTLRLYRTPSVREVSLQERQIWHYNSDNNRWYVAPDLTPYKIAGLR